MKLEQYVISEIKWATHARDHESEDVRDEAWCKGFVDAMELVRDKIIKDKYDEPKK